ncbi:MAG: integrase [Desulfuromonadales bacterium C00003068]|nr:MAG: integrase [Desulfuromonadales bacterium C00003068]
MPFSFKKRSYFYFIRHVPSDLSHHYAVRKISYSLRTKSPRLATKRSLVAAEQLDEYWGKLRGDSEQIPEQHFAATDPVRTKETGSSAPDLGPLLSDATSQYLHLKGHNRPKTFATSARRACSYLFETSGDKHLAEYTKKDATTFRDALFERGINGSSVGRVLGTIKSIFNFAVNENGLDLRNPFSNVYFDRSIGVSVRQPISIDDVKKIQNACLVKDDPIRWLVALISDSGLRLAEGAGLLIDDIHIDSAGISYVEVKPHPWRRLKTASSERIVPLVGSSLWAAKRIVEENDNGFAFPRYNQDDQTNSNSASAALNKWIKQIGSDTATMHGFRHSMRDRLREVSCQSELIDQIGGWSNSGNVGQSYGSGYSLKVMHDWMKKVVIQ